jgi:hypothetical protein
MNKHVHTFQERKIEGKEREKKGIEEGGRRRGVES